MAEIVGKSVLHRGDSVKYGLLPASGEAFSADSFPLLAEEFPSLHLPVGDEHEHIVSGINKIATQRDVVISEPNKAEIWQPLTQGLNSGAPLSGGNSYIVSVRGDGHGVFVVLFGGGEAARSDDAGVTWTALPQYLNCDASAGRPYSIQTDGNGVWVAGFSNGYASRSDDNGVSWSQLSPVYLHSGGSNHIYSMGTDGQGNWVAGFHSGHAARSTDNGITWSTLPQNLGTGTTYSIKILNCVVGSPSGVFIACSQRGWASRSTDNGLTWSALPQALNNGTANDDIVATHRGLATDGKGVWVAQADDGYVSRSEDDGLTWTPLPRHLNSGSTGVQAEGVETNGKGVWVATWYDGTVARSVDNGITWTALPQYLNSGSNGSAYAAASSGDVWVAGFNETYAAIASGETSTTIKEWFIE
ncbi:sialidase family protein [Thalassomonas sp. RHCl1]|uniref:WD40/YVTN/BNR-like repeat-containing protein n=1 Tax=Thalassomonas sp. RHCl1 TaxID=2995320 RepID=UPI00248D326D|nr:sialidase family protein [Thalassomonas sp. RHCl1]